MSWLPPSTTPPRGLIHRFGYPWARTPKCWPLGRQQVTADEWVSLYAEPDEDAFVARAERAFGVDTLNPPSLNARQRGAASGI